MSLGAAGTLSGYFVALFTQNFLWQNIFMPRWLMIALFVVLGIGLGILYGWVIQPVQYVDTTPSSLRVDYRADYVLMVAEAYHSDQNAGLAVRRLSILGGDSPATLVSQALQFGRQNGYASSDLSLLQDLLRAMQIYQPLPATQGIATP